MIYLNVKLVVLSFVLILASQACAILFAETETISTRIILGVLGNVFTWPAIWAAFMAGRNSHDVWKRKGR
jgi:hypothetical protein